MQERIKESLGYAKAHVHVELCGEKLIAGGPGIIPHERGPLGLRSCF